MLSNKRKKEVAIVWFRQDLRLDDNEALHQAYKTSDNVVGIYVFDERIFRGKTKFGFPKTSAFRAQFIIDSIVNLRNKIQNLGGELIVRVGKPEEIVAKLAKELHAGWVYCNRERTQEEVLVQNKLESNLWSYGKELRFTRGKMLYYTSDLPFPISHTPDSFSQFRKEVEKFIEVREPLETGKLAWRIPPNNVEAGDIPNLADFNLEYPANAKSGIYPGGEDAGLARLNYFIWESKKIETYKKTRDSLIGDTFSSKFSMYLSQGCLSPKRVYHEISRFENEVKKNESTYWLKFELMWRDYFRLIGKKYGNSIFQLNGIAQNETNILDDYDPSTVDHWINGTTGIPFIDANMLELQLTGFMSNRGRQNVASFLVKDLEQNWLVGAEYFESMLIDYDPCSNYCNWNYISGVGTDTRSGRYFNILTQAKKYDPNGDFVKFWLPKLKDMGSAESIHIPKLSNGYTPYNVKPIFDSSVWL